MTATFPAVQARLDAQVAKYNLLGVGIDATDYRRAVARIIEAATSRRPLAVTALAVHGVMTGVLDPEHRHRLNCLDLVVPDGQPVRWALNLLHGTRLPDRVYGPTLMLEVCAEAAQRALPVYLYGSRPEVLERLTRRLTARLPELEIAGAEPSKFRTLSAGEKAALVTRIQRSGARLVFAGLGCPRQEVWAYEYREPLAMPVLAVGAAFDFHAGLLKQAPPRLQQLGLEWAYRLYREPRRLWKRYVYLNPLYVGHVALQAAGLRHYPMAEGPAPDRELGHG